MATGTQEISSELVEEYLQASMAHMEIVQRQLLHIDYTLRQLLEIAEPARGWRLPQWLRHR